MLYVVSPGVAVRAGAAGRSTFGTVSTSYEPAQTSEQHRTSWGMVSLSYNGMVQQREALRVGVERRDATQATCHVGFACRKAGIELCRVRPCHVGVNAGCATRRQPDRLVARIHQRQHWQRLPAISENRLRSPTTWSSLSLLSRIAARSASSSHRFPLPSTRPLTFALDTARPSVIRRPSSTQRATRHAYRRLHTLGQAASDPRFHPVCHEPPRTAPAATRSPRSAPSPQLLYFAHGLSRQ